MVTKRLVGILLAVAFGVGNLYKFSPISADVHVSILDCVIILLTAISVLKNRHQYFSSLKRFKIITVPILIFAAVAGVSLIISGGHYGQMAQTVGAMYLLRWVIYSLFFVSLIQLVKAREAARLLLILGLVTAAVGLGQYIFYPDVRGLAVAEWDPHYFRVVSSWLDPGFTGLLLVFTLIFLTLKPLSKKWLQWLIWGVTYIALALTYSRSSYLAFLAAMAWLAWKTARGWRFFAKVAVLLTITVLILPRASSGEGVKLERTNSIYARITNWQHSLLIFKDQPISGVGFNTYRYAQRQYGFISDTKWLRSHAGAGADSSLLFVAATTGILGLGVYLWYLKRIYQFPNTNYQLQATLVALLVHSWFLNSLFYPAVMVWLSLLVLYAFDSRLGRWR